MSFPVQRCLTLDPNVAALLAELSDTPPLETRTVAQAHAGMSGLRALQE